MTKHDQKQLGKTLWHIADQLRGAMNADDFRDYMRYSRRVEMEEIEDNDYNLNISRYVSTVVAEPEIDLAATHRHLAEIETTIQEATRKHNDFLKELGLPPLPSPKPDS